MGDIFKPITNLAGGLLGQTDDQYHAKQANNNASTANAEGQGWRLDAAGGFKNLGGQGQAESSAFTDALPGLLKNYENTAGTQTSNPYALTDAENTMLNGQVDQLNARQQNAIQNYHAEMAKRGISDPGTLAAGEAQIRNGFGGLISQHSAAFTENARQQRQAAQMQELNFLHGVGQSGTQAQEASASGTAGLGAQASGVGQSQAQLAQQYDAANNANLSSLLQLGGYAAGGGFTGVPNTTKGNDPGMGGADYSSGYDVGGFGGGLSGDQGGFAGLDGGYFGGLNGDGTQGTNAVNGGGTKGF